MPVPAGIFKCFKRFNKKKKKRKKILQLFKTNDTDLDPTLQQQILQHSSPFSQQKLSKLCFWSKLDQVSPSAESKTIVIFIMPKHIYTDPES